MRLHLLSLSCTCILFAGVYAAEVPVEPPLDVVYESANLEESMPEEVQRLLPSSSSEPLNIQGKRPDANKKKRTQKSTLRGEQGSVPMPVLSDEELMDVVQRRTFEYFWEYAHPVSGLAREKTGDTDRVTSGGSGFGVMAILAGVHRKYITREEAALRLLKMVHFLRDKAERHHGVWPHWLNGSSGKTIPFSPEDDGGDIVETAFMIQGLLAARQAFSGADPVETELREMITQLWHEVEWDWYTQGEDVIYWHWSPRVGFKMNLQVSGYNECMIVYLLAMASPTHPVATKAYHEGWAHPGYQNRLKLNWPRHLGGPLFLTHYSHLGMTPYIADSHVLEAGYASYFERNREQTLHNRQWCIQNQHEHSGYGENCWGLTSSHDPDKGYSNHQPAQKHDNGTISPTAAISSIIYTPEESLAAMRHFYEEHGPSGLWGQYGFKDAFNEGQDWIAEGYLAIDQGPIVVMIENHRSGLLWQYFMRDPDICRMMKKVGLTVTSSATR